MNIACRYCLNILRAYIVYIKVDRWPDVLTADASCGWKHYNIYRVFTLCKYYVQILCMNIVCRYCVNILRANILYVKVDRWPDVLMPPTVGGTIVSIMYLHCSNIVCKYCV